MSNEVNDEKLPSHSTHWASPQANQRDVSICPQIVDHGPQIILLKTAKNVKQSSR